MLTKASDAKIIDAMGRTKDEINLKAAEAMSDYYDSVYGNTTSSPVYSNTELAKTYLKTVGTMQDDGKIIWDDEFKKKTGITVSGLTVKNGSTEVADGSKSVAPNTALTINFTAEITEGSIQSISPTLPYTTNGTETSKTFTITGTGGVTKEYTVNLKGYYNIPDLKVGDFVNYKLKTPTTEELAQLNNDIATYSGASAESSGGGTANEQKTAVEGNTLLCRVLEIDETTGNPTKLISADGVNSLRLYGANGYNNAVYLINEMCKTLYSGNQGTTTSLTIEDLENNYFNSTVRDTEKSNYSYGTTTYYASNAKYPNIAQEEAGMGIGTTLVDGKNTIRTGGLGLSQQETTYLPCGSSCYKSKLWNPSGI